MRPQVVDVPFAEELIETHTSRVFLAGDRAYKLKKPVKFPFLDYSSLHERERLCHEEVRLNRRLAPTTYLGVRSVLTGPNGGISLGGPTEPDAIDYVVEMRRIPADATLAARVRSDLVTQDDIAAVAQVIAHFHELAERTERAAPADLKRQLDDSFAELVELPDVSAGLRDLEPLLAPAVRRLMPELARRADAGFVRDGHGDLRAEHVVLSDPVEIFDCIEFDPGLRRIDVGCDLAFLVMDLERLGRRDLAETLVKDYRRAGGDPGSDQLIALFAAYRAVVRAKVALLRAGQLNGEPRRRLASEAGTLAELAGRCAWRTAVPLVVVVCGPAASGKTTLASALSEASGLPRVATDVTRKRLAGMSPTQRAPAAAYDPATSLRTYRELGALAAQEVARAGGVIVDGTFRRRSERGVFRAALGPEPQPVFVQCVAPRDVLAARAAERLAAGAGESDAGAGQAVQQLAEFEALDEVDAARHLVTRTDCAPAELARDAERRLLAAIH